MRPIWELKRLRSLVLGSAAIAAAATGLHVPAAAQSGSREIVQPLPPAESRALRNARQRLSRNPADLLALLDAGEASVTLGDVEAAAGFFARAAEVSPGSGRAMAGLGRVAVKRMQPVQALQMFAQAERAGLAASQFAADRGLAYDLVGDNARAQTMYRTALRSRDIPSVRRNLALSLAISGERQAFEAVLLPLLDKGDRAAFRTRAFGLAVLDDTDAAIKIAEAMMPTDLALRMTPYLRYMPRLTKAQQAAAGSLGVFPPAAQIGTDSAAIASYAVQGGNKGANADAGLVPSGPVMGTSNRSASSRADARRARPDRRSSVANSRVQREASSDPLQRTQVAPRVREPQQTAAQPVTRQPVQTTVQSTPASQSQTTPPPVSPPAPEPVLVAEVAEPSSSAELPAVRTDTSFDLAEARSEPVVAVAETPTPQAPSVADAFSAFAGATTSTPSPAATAVDITAIEPPREVAQAEPAAPQHPSRHWVQVATGRDLAALQFDWRRIARRSEGALDGMSPFTVRWGQANRLLAGPYDDAAAARAKVNELKEAGLDSFTFTSDQGQAIEKLD